MMEGSNNIENKVEDFDSFKSRIEVEFNKKRSPQELLSQIKEWRSKKVVELDKLRSNTKEHEVLFLLESAQLFGIIERFDDSWDCLSGAWQYADQREDIELKATVEHWMNIIHGKKE